MKNIVKVRYKFTLLMLIELFLAQLVNYTVYILQETVQKCNMCNENTIYLHLQTKLT